MMRFADPWFALLLVLIVPMIFYGRLSGGRIRFSSIKTLKSISSGLRLHPRMILLALRVACFVLLVMAFMRPQSGKKYSEISSDGVDIFMALDTSGSMKALDFKIGSSRVTRLEMVKKVVTDFVDKRPADRLGLVVFGTEAYTQCPLTLDHGIVVEFLKKTEIGMAGEATAIGSAIGTAVKRMKDLKSKSKIIILLTDGRNTAGRISPIQASEIAKTFGIKVYTIGVGTRGKAPFLVDTFFGKRHIYQEVEIDEKMLTDIANKTGAKYYRATHTEELQKIYDEIDKLEKTEIKVKEYTEYNELFHLFLMFALLLLLIEIVLGNTKLRKIP